MARIFILCFLLLGGLYTGCTGLLELGRSVVFVYNAQTVPGVVIDQRERPFEDWGEMLAHGNMPWESSTAHQPIVGFSLLGRPCTADNLTDLDSRNHANGEQVELLIRSVPNTPPSIHINEFRFIWAGGLLRLAGGLLLILLYRGVRRSKLLMKVSRSRHEGDSTPQTTSPPKERPLPHPQRKKRKKSSSATNKASHPRKKKLKM